MFCFSKPTDAQIREYLARQAGKPCSYDCVGCTRDTPHTRRGWNTDQHRVLLGHGEQVFRRATQAIESWKMFPPKIATLHCPPSCRVGQASEASAGPPSSLPREGLAVAVLYWAAPLRLWLLMGARIVYLINETIDRDGRRIERFGFAYGTLPDHPERGEERFLVEWDRTDDSVHYDLLAISQPCHFLARLGYPYTRYEQSRFRRLSAAAMQRAVAPQEK